MISLHTGGTSNSYFENNKKNNLETYKSDLELLTYILSHDFKKPIRVLCNNSKELLNIFDKTKLDDANSLLQEINDTSTEMQEIFNILLEYIRIGIFEPDYALVDMNEIVQDALSNLHTQIQQVNALVNVKELPNVIGHKKQLIILFENIISNSLKYRSLNILPNINISYKMHEEFIEFIVSDNGIGIEDEYFEIIFILFQRLHTKEEYPGFGSGLAISKKIIEAHGGQIWVNSIVEKETNIHFTLRINKGEGGHEKL